VFLMPGLVGILSMRRTGCERETVRSMVGVMLDEPFYTRGFFENEVMGVYVSFVALEGSSCDCMPVWNEDRSVALFLTGENFAERNTIEGLARRGHFFNPFDASYLVHLYEELSDEFVGV